MLYQLSLASDAATLSPIALFLQADIIVKAVMVTILITSVYVWAIILSHSYDMSRRIRVNAQLQREFKQINDIGAFYKDKARKNPLLVAGIVTAGIVEWQHSLKAGATNTTAIADRIAGAMHNVCTEEIDRYVQEIAILATIGAVAPFVGLFGTVWGIMRAFTGIAAQNSTSLAVVAPGIAEALFATALGLFAAIPAVVAYNLFSQRLNRFASHMERFVEELHAMFSRDLEAQQT